MINTLVTFAEHIAQAYGAWGIFGLAFLQEIIPPIPSTIVVMSAGFLLFAGQAINLGTLVHLVVIIGIPVALGLSLGAYCVYKVVWFLGKASINRWGSYIGISWSDIERAQVWMKSHQSDNISLFIARATPIMPSTVLNVIAGIVRWPALSFVLLTALGTVIRASFIGFIGWQVGNVYAKYSYIFENVEKGLLILTIIGAICFIVYRKMKSTITVA